MSTFAVNLSNQATTKLTTYLWVRTWRLGDTYYGLDKTGIYTYGGTNDFGDSIVPTIQTCNNDFGYPEPKRLNEVRLDKDGTVTTSVIYDTQTLNQGVEPRNDGHVKFGKGDRWWTLSVNISSVDATFKLYGLDLYPQVLSMAKG